MRRKNRKWVALAVALYVFILWRAWRWGGSQRIPEGHILVRLEREELRRRAAERAKQAAATALPQPEPNGESRLVAAEPAFVAARYDATHVVFIVASDIESRYSNSPRFQSGEWTKVSDPPHSAAPLAGLAELWEPDPHSVRFFPQLIQNTHPGEQWHLSLSADTTIPVTIERVVVAPTGCSLSAGFLASIPVDQQAAFAASSRHYFVVRHTSVAQLDPPAPTHVGEGAAFHQGSDFYRQVEQQLVARMRQEVSVSDPRVTADVGEIERNRDVASAAVARTGMNWLQEDRALRGGEGKLDYDMGAFHLTPDSTPRLYVRARWTLEGTPAFLMTAWFKAESVDSSILTADPTRSPIQPVLLFSDSSWSRTLRESEVVTKFGRNLNFQSILNVFDADHDGWAELLIYSDEGKSSTITPYLYTDKALVPLKLQFRREDRTAESCLNQ